MTRYPRTSLAILTIACLAPWVNKAFDIDDPLFLWSAQQILRVPLDFYGIDVNWYFEPRPLSEVTKNPPLCSYYLAVVASVTGFREVPLHLAMMLPAVALVLGTYELARRFTRRPGAAAMMGLAMPAVLISATFVMCDVMMAAFWIWGLAFWIRGIDRRVPWCLLVASLLMAAAALTKYFGLAALPLAILYAVARVRRPGLWLFFPCVTIAICAAFEVYFRGQYGLGAFTSAAEYATESIDDGRLGPQWRGLVTLFYAGGVLLPALLLTPWLWSWRMQVVWATVTVVVALSLMALASMPTARLADLHFRSADGIHWNTVAHATLFVVAAVQVLTLLAIEAVRRHEIETLFLSAWILGTLVFTAWINWTVNARSILPAAPAAAILLARRFDGLTAISVDSGFRYRSFQAALVVALGLSLSLVAADVRSANANRDAAISFSEKLTPANGVPKIWFGGHWGFQYYLQPTGASPLNLRDSTIRFGELVVIPEDNAVGLEFPPDWRVVATAETPLARWATTVSDVHQASMYSIEGGPFPFRFTAVAPRKFRVYDPLSKYRGAVEPAR